MITDWCEQGRAWSDLKIGDDVFMISVLEKDDSFEVSLTNLVEIWMEALTRETFIKKCQKLNPLLNVDGIDCNKIMINLLNNVSKYIVDASVEQIKLHIDVEGDVVKFDFNLSKATPEHFWKVVTKPLCLSSIELKRQHKILLDLIKKKDDEIAEYKAEGAQLLRKHIETNAFNEEQLKIQSTVPNIFDCTNAFQAMMNFYNALDLCQLQVNKSQETFPGSTSCITERMETRTATCDETNTTSQCIPVTCNSGSLQMQTDTESSISEKNIVVDRRRHKKKSKHTVAYTKKKIISIPQSPRTNLKKGVHDFIL